MNKKGEPGLRLRVPVAVAAVLVAADTGFYAALVERHGSRFGFVAGSLLAGAGLPVLGAASRRARMRLFAVALGACTILIWTVLGSASIGLFILPSAVLLLVATGGAARNLPPGQAGPLIAAAVLIAVVVAVAGLSWTS